MAQKSSAVNKKPAFKNETEEADWLASPSGRRSVSRSFRAAIRKGVIQSDASTQAEMLTAVRQAGRGRAVQFKNKKAG